MGKLTYVPALFVLQVRNRSFRKLAIPIWGDARWTISLQDVTGATMEIPLDHDGGSLPSYRANTFINHGDSAFFIVGLSETYSVDGNIVFNTEECQVQIVLRWKNGVFRSNVLPCKRY